jgi:hypothetical protein
MYMIIFTSFIYIYIYIYIYEESKECWVLQIRINGYYKFTFTKWPPKVTKFYM